MMKLVVIACACAACGTTLKASDYASDCDADTQCLRVRVGDICACSCDIVAINISDEGKYESDYERIGGCRNSCISGNGDAGFSCGEGLGPQCTAGKCTIVQLPTDAAAE